MQTLQELGQSVAQRRKSLGLQQGEVALRAGITPESLSRFERGRSAEFGSRKLLAVLAVLNAELDVIALGQAGHLDMLRAERSAANLPSAGSPSAGEKG